MLNELAWSAAPAGCAAVTLGQLWRVDAGPSYHPLRAAPDAPVLVAVRTLAGRGRVEFFDRGGLDLPVETLAVLENQSIREYGCEGPRWRFWWFCFRLDGVPPFPLHRVLPVPPDNREEADVADCARLLASEDAASRALASATFCHVLHRWLAHWREGRPRPGPHTAAVEAVIEAMRRDFARPLTVRQMAWMAHLSERRFRQVFAETTGKSPKRFYDELRLAAAAEMLRAGGMNVSQVADALGYSSPFHFSREFRRRRGVPPSRWR